MQKVLDSFKTLYPDNRPLSVLMLGIDSISRLNLIRAMPNVAQHLYDTGWFELKGYNKVRVARGREKYVDLFISIFTDGRQYLSESNGHTRRIQSVTQLSGV